VDPADISSSVLNKGEWAEARILAASCPSKIAKGLEPITAFDGVDPITHFEPAYEGQNLVRGEIERM
jgi:hypothetical protein